MSPSKVDETGKIRIQCFICDEPALLQCEQCKEAFFCSSDHGRLHHREGVCYPYKVRHSDGQRCLVTTQDVAMGELLYVEHPLVVGPNHAGDPVCLSCLKPVYSNYVCGDCEYPMCSTECAHDPRHAEECGINTKAKLTRK